MNTKYTYAEAVETLTTLFTVVGILLCLQLGLLNKTLDAGAQFAAAQEVCCEHIGFPHQGHTDLPAIPACSCGEANCHQLTPKFVPAAAPGYQHGLMLLAGQISTYPGLHTTAAAAFPIQRHILYRSLLI